MNKIILLVVIGLFFSMTLANQSHKPENGFVPDKKTAIAIAEAIWLPIYGENNLKRKKPFTAKLKDNKVWIVEGTLNVTRKRKDSTEVIIIKGGVPYIEINKADCKILKVTHGK